LPLLAQVCPDASTAQRSKASGKLIITMPKEHPDSNDIDVANVRYVSYV